MSGDMIERVARAIAPEVFSAAKRRLSREQSRAMDDARRAIEAMREPNAHMFDAGLETTRDNPAEVWRVMIAAALKEPGRQG